MVKNLSYIFIILGVIFGTMFGLWANDIKSISINSIEWSSFRAYFLFSIIILGLFIFIFLLHDFFKKTTQHLTLFLNMIIKTTLVLVGSILAGVIFYFIFNLINSFINWSTLNISDLKEILYGENLKYLIRGWWVLFLICYIDFFSKESPFK